MTEDVELDPHVARECSSAESEDPWLSAHEQRVWRAFLAATRMLDAHLETQLQRDSGMPATYYEVLVRLSEAPNRTMRMSELAEACHSSRSKLSHAVARMEDSGWVHRSACPTDKRGSFAALTAQGAEALQQAAPGHAATVRRYLFDVLTAEQVESLEEISTTISAGLAGECAKAAESDEPGHSGGM